MNVYDIKISGGNVGNGVAVLAMTETEALRIAHEYVDANTEDGVGYLVELRKAYSLDRARIIHACEPAGEAFLRNITES